MEVIRAKIIDELQRVLNALAPTLIFEVYSMDKTPLIILRDSDDECEAYSFEATKHSLEVEIIAIDAGYENNSVLIAKILETIGALKSKNFIKKELLSISRETSKDGNPSIALGSKLMYSATIRVRFTYLSELWGY